MPGVQGPRPLTADDDLSSFDCGRESLNDWLRRHAWSNHSANISRVSVIQDAASSGIVGYVTLSSAQIERAYLPKADRRSRPKVIPVTLLGQLAVHKVWQGRGHAASMLAFALRAAFYSSQSVASFGVVVHPLDDALRVFYALWDFRDLTFDPQRAMFLRMMDLQASLERG